VGSTVPQSAKMNNVKVLSAAENSVNQAKGLMTSSSSRTKKNTKGESKKGGNKKKSIWGNRKGIFNFVKKSSGKKQ